MSLITERILQIKNNTNPYFVAELQTGYVVVADHQTFLGYTVFICKENVTELHDLATYFRQEFLLEMSIVAECVWNVFHPDKLNYELLGNVEPQLHWHIIPRYKTDPAFGKPIWSLPKDIRTLELSQPDYDILKAKILAELQQLCNDRIITTYKNSK